MTVEDVFSGAKSGLTMFFAYMGTVGEEIGMERAIALDTKTCEAMGAAQGEMIKEQAGIEEFDVQTAGQMLSSAIEQGYGILSERMEETPREVVFRVGRCPVYEAARALGMDDETIEASCRAGPVRFMDAIAKELNADLSYELREFRSGANEPCVEALTMA
jgi:hypothetical protein